MVSPSWEMLWLFLKRFFSNYACRHSKVEYLCISECVLLWDRTFPVFWLWQQQHIYLTHYWMLGTLLSRFCATFHPYSSPVQFSSVQSSRSVVSDSLWPHESQHTRPPCPLPTLWIHSNSCPSNRWCHPTISSSVVPFFSCPHPSQDQSLFQWVNSSHEVAKVLEFQL